jgi:Tol biopolymer transport system component
VERDRLTNRPFHRPASILLLMLLSLAMLFANTRAQDALNLPADLYVLLNTGVVQRYGLGAAGVSDITPANIFVVDFGVAPDGDQIAYRTESSISILSISGALPERIIEREADVPPYRGRGDTIAWSPDQSGIAYTTTYGIRVFFNLGDVAAYADLREGLFTDLIWSPDSRFLAGQTDSGVWWVYRREATTMSLASVIPAANGIAWVGGSQIVFAPPEGGLILMELEQANAQSVILDAGWEYALPALNARDELVYFARDKNDSATPAGYGRLQSIARGAFNVVARSDTPVQTTGLRWAPGGALLTAFDGGALAVFDPVSGQGFTLPVRDAVAYTWGRFNPAVFFATQAAPPITSILTPTPETALVGGSSITAVAGLPMTEDAFFLAYGEFNVPQIWRLPASGAPAAPLTTARSGISEYAVSPDGSAIVYVSDGQLWLYSLLSGRISPLVRLESVGIASPVFSPDARQIAYTDGGIRAVSVTGGASQVILLDTPEAQQPSYFGEPQYSPDGARLLISELLPGTNGLHGVIDLSDGSYQRLQTDYGARALWLSDGSIISFGVSSVADLGAQQSIVRFAPSPSDPAEVIYTLDSSARVETVIESVRGEIRLIASQTGAAPAMIDVAFASGEQATITSLPSIAAPRLSYDGGFVAGYLSQTEVDGIRQGPLTLYNANNGEQVLLGSPTSVWSFQWAR